MVVGFLAVGLALLPFSDFSITARDPWGALGRLAMGLVTPKLSSPLATFEATLYTVAFAIVAVMAGAVAGLALAVFYRSPVVRSACVFIRSIHELFWALLFIQVYGISVTTGVLAIALPYSGIFAKVFSEYLDEADRRPRDVLPEGTDSLSRFLFAGLPLAAPEMRTYTLYRLECGIRSSAVLGFIGLPTLGFELDAVFKNGDYSAVGAILLIYFTLIISIRLWLRWWLVPLYICAALVVLAWIPSPPVGSGSLWRFLTSDIVPQPLRGADPTDPLVWAKFVEWLSMVLETQALPGVFATLAVAQFGLILTALIAFLCFPLLVPKVVGPTGASAGHLGLVVGRSMPDYMLAFVFVQLLGPSMLPAILALGLHNGAIIAHLLGHQAEQLSRGLRADAPTGLDLATYELTPRLYGNFIALCLYRWEIIIRETSILGMLGIATLGFHIDSAVGELRMDRVFVLLLATAAVTLAIDALSRRLRSAVGSSGLKVMPGPPQ